MHKKVYTKYNPDTNKCNQCRGYIGYVGAHGCKCASKCDQSCNNGCDKGCDKGCNKPYENKYQPSPVGYKKVDDQFLNVCDLKVNKKAFIRELCVKCDATVENLCVDCQTRLQDLCVNGETQLNDLSVLDETKLNDLCVEGDTKLEGDVCIGSLDPKTQLVVKGNALFNCDLDAPGCVRLGSCDECLTTNTIVRGNLNVDKNLDVCGDLTVKGAVYQITEDNVCIEGRLRVKDVVCIEGDAEDQESLLKVNEIQTFDDTIVTFGDDVFVNGGLTANNVNAVNDVNAGNDVVAQNNVCANGSVITNNVDSKQGTDTIVVGANLQLDTHDLTAGTINSFNNIVAGQDVIATNVTTSNDVNAGNNVCIDGLVQVDTIEAKTPNGDVSINTNLAITGNVTAANFETPGIVLAEIVDAAAVNVSTDVCVEGGVQTDLIEAKTDQGFILIDTAVNVTGNLTAAGFETSGIIQANIINTGDLNASNDVCVEGGLLTDLILGKTGQGFILIDSAVNVTGQITAPVVCATENVQTDQINCKESDQVLINCDLCVGSGNTLFADTIQGKAEVNPQTTINNDLIVEGNTVVNGNVTVGNTDGTSLIIPNDSALIVQINDGISTQTVPSTAVNTGALVLVSALSEADDAPSGTFWVDNIVDGVSFDINRYDDNGDISVAALIINK